MSQKHWPLRLIRNYSTYAKYCLSKILLKKKWSKFFFFNFWFLKISEKFFRKFFSTFLVKTKLRNCWLYYVKIRMLYCKQPLKYRQCENCTKNNVFFPQNEFGVKIIYANAKNKFSTLTLTLCSKMSWKCQTVPLKKTMY